MKNRNIALCVIFSILTCGLYGLYWIVPCTDEMDLVVQTDYHTSGILAVVFSLLTCGIYGIYWAYKMGEKLNAAQGNQSGSNHILFLILSIFGLNIVNLCLLQNEINKHAEN